VLPATKVTLKSAPAFSQSKIGKPVVALWSVFSHRVVLKLISTALWRAKTKEVPSTAPYTL